MSKNAKELWDYFKELHKDMNIIHSTDLKLNFINMIIKDLFGGEKDILFGKIGGEDIFDGKVFAYLHTCKYEYNQDIAIITEFHWIHRPNDIALGYKKSNILNIISDLCDVVDLKLGYVSYMENDVNYNTFEKLGFIKTDLKTDQGCFIMIRNPNIK